MGQQVQWRWVVVAVFVSEQTTCRNRGSQARDRPSNSDTPSRQPGSRHDRRRTDARPGTTGISAGSINPSPVRLDAFLPMAYRVMLRCATECDGGQMAVNSRVGSLPSLGRAAHASDQSEYPPLNCAASTGASGGPPAQCVTRLAEVGHAARAAWASRSDGFGGGRRRGQARFDQPFEAEGARTSIADQESLGPVLLRRCRGRFQGITRCHRADPGIWKMTGWLVHRRDDHPADCRATGAGDAILSGLRTPRGHAGSRDLHERCRPVHLGRLQRGRCPIRAATLP
jgi:hypothetical protein